MQTVPIQRIIWIFFFNYSFGCIGSWLQRMDPLVVSYGLNSHK